VKIIYFDFEKAFDSVSVPKLLYKLRHFGIRGRLFSCIESFLTNRSQRVRVGNCLSNSLSVISGVPQGSVLGPFLFLLFINDLPDIIDDGFHAKLFADDLKSYNIFDYRVNPSAVQISLDSVSAWADKWQLRLSTSKCGSLLLNNNSWFEDETNLLLGNNSLAVFDTVKDLGVIVDSNLSFSPHIDSVISKAKQRIYLIFKSFESRDIALFTFAYKTYILPILDYCSSIWSPYKFSAIDRLENVQRFFTKRLKGLWNKSYAERLGICKLTSLELRRLIFDIILCYKIINKLVSLEFSDFFEFDHNIRTRGHNFKLRIPKFKTNFRQYFFSVRIVPVWNSLPYDIVNSTSVSQLKNLLNGFNLSTFLIRNYDVFN
jgi:ribonucleases P/MRP protein subunit RPP40